MDLRAVVARGWVVNACCSPLAACLGMLLTFSFGFRSVLLAGAAASAGAAFEGRSFSLNNVRDLQ